MAKSGKTPTLKPELVAQLTIDRTGITVRPVPVRAKAAAWAAILGLYVIGWGEGVRVAIVMLFGWVSIPDEWPVGTVQDRTTSIVRDIAVVLIAAALIWAFRQYANASVRPASWRTSLKTFPVAYFAIAMGFGVRFGLDTVFGLTSNQFTTQPFDDPFLAVLNIVSDGMAGPTEELVLLALVVVALRATGHSWVVVVAAAIAVRVPFHLYYGWGAVGLAIWAVLMVLLYRRTGAILAIVLAHATFNVLTYAGDLGGLFKGVVILLGLGTVLTIFGNGVDRRAKEVAASTS